MATADIADVGQVLPDHTQLPDSDGKIVENLQELPQDVLLTNVILPRLNQLHPDRQYAVGGNSGIYWKITDPPLDGCKAPDWFYVPGVHHALANGQRRRSYVMWQEHQPPLIVMEYVSGDGSEEHDQTPNTGKFWVYENGIRAEYYVIFDSWRTTLEVYRRVQGKFQPVLANEHGHYPIEPMGVSLGIWHGVFMNQDFPWLRWCDDGGNLLPLPEEVAEQEKQRADQEKQRAKQEKQRADQEKQRAERLAAKLREMGVDPDQV